MARRQHPVVNGVLGVIVGFCFAIFGTSEVKPFGIGIIIIGIIMILLFKNDKTY